MSAVQPLRWSVVGTGAVSASFVSDLHIVKNAAPISIVSRNPATARLFADRHKVPFAYQFQDALHDEKVDVIYIATPPATHHVLAAAALSAGKHVVVEKPLAMNAYEARDLFAIASRNDRFLMEAMWMKFNPTYLAARAAVREGRIGQVRSIRASFGLPFPSDAGSRRHATLGGSALLDQGIYPVTLVHSLLGEPERLQIAGRSVEGVDVSHWATFEFSDGRFAQIAGSMEEYTDPSAAISGTDGWISLDPPFWASSGFTLRSGDIASAFTAPERIEKPTEGWGYAPMIHAISEAINEGRRHCTEHTPEDTFAVIDLLARLRTKLL